MLSVPAWVFLSVFIPLGAAVTLPKPASADVISQSEVPLSGHGSIQSPDALDRAAPRPAGPIAAVPPGTLRNPYPRYRWPLGRALGDGLIVVNYVDHDPGPALRDYEGGTHTYGGHAGIDYSLYNFRLMDRGCPIYAAAAGTVAYLGSVTPGAFDRRCDFSMSPDDGNWVWIDNGDGTYSEYFHLRAWSLTVGVGEMVQAGQMLGLIGSSGYSTGPHLHFETGDYFGGSYAWRDPYTGPENPLPSLWYWQDDYQGDDPLHFVDLGVYSDDAVGGSVFNTTYCDTQEGIHGPAVFGVHEPHLDLWVQFQGNPGDSLRVEIRRPDGSIWRSFQDVMTYDARFDWFWAYWNWDGWVAPTDVGTWRVRTYADDVFSREASFVVGPNTIYGPRLRRAGRSFRINGTAQRDTLRLTPLSPAVTYSLSGAPPQVTLADSILTIGASSSQTTRSAFFRVVARDASARADTAWYHLVDMTRPLEPPASTTVETTMPMTQSSLILAARPNPATGSVSLEYRLGQNEPVTLSIFDIAGRRVRTLTSRTQAAGDQRVAWDGFDDSGDRAPPGVYLARITAGSLQGEVRLVRLR